MQSHCQILSLFLHLSDESLIKERQGHRIADWSDQVKRGVEELCVSVRTKWKLPIIINNLVQDNDVFKHHPGRDMPGACGYERKNKVDFKVNNFKVSYHAKSTKLWLQGLKRHIKRYNRELVFYIKVNHNKAQVPYVLEIFIFRTPLAKNEGDLYP